jgi:hypothetical protein
MSNAIIPISDDGTALPVLKGFTLEQLNYFDRSADLLWIRQLGEDMVVQGTQANLDEWELFQEQYSTDVAAMKALRVGLKMVGIANKVKGKTDECLL